jgi:hypothetical protein
VVAVTVLPKSSLVSNTWLKWWDFMKKVHTLIYIRNLINDKQQQKQQQQQKQEEEKGKEKENEEKEGHTKQLKLDVIKLSDGESVEDSNTIVKTLTKQQSREEVSTSIALNNGNETNTSYTATATATATVTVTTTKEFMYNDFNVLEYAKSLGYINEEVDIVAEFIDGMGVEEFSVFAVNYARKAGGLGLTWKKKTFDKYDLKRLKTKKDEIIKELKESCNNLVEARNNFVKEDNNVELSVGSLSEDDEAPTQSVHRGSVNDDDDDYLYEKGRLSLLHTNNNDTSPIGTCRRRSSIHSRRRGRRGSVWFTGDQLDLAIRKLDAMKSSPIDESHQMKDGLQAEIKEGGSSCLHRIVRGTEADVVTPKYDGDTDNVNMIDDESLQNNDFIKEGRAFLTDHIHPSYAVATFTSRYAAIIARQCLVDGGGTSAWRKVDGIPIYPLADSPPNMFFPSGLM